MRAVGAPRRVFAHVRARPLLSAAVLVAASLYTAFALLRWTQLHHGGYDLGIFDQTVWHYSRFELPANTVKNYDNIWGDHFSPILVLLAPLYWIWDDARMLLIAQALLLAAAAVPIFAYANGRLGRVPAHLLAIAYLAFWGVQSALAWDFHELAFLPLVLACLLLAADRRRWGAYFALLFALLCIKEDQAIVAIFLGIYVATMRAWRQAALTVALGVVWYVLVVKLLIPHFNPDGEYSYWSYSQFGDDPLSALRTALAHPRFTLETLLGDPVKRETLLLMFAPLLGLCLFSRTAILLVPLVAQRFLSTNPQYWTTDFHYTLAVAPLLFIGAADGLANVLRLLPRPAPRALAPGLAAVMLAGTVVALVAAPGGTGGPQKLYDALRPSAWRTSVYVDTAKEAVAAVPDDASVTAQDNLIPRLTHRETAHEITAGVPVTDYVVAHTLEGGGRGMVVNQGFINVSRFVEERLKTHVPVAFLNGWLVLRARSLPPVPRAPQLVPVEGADAAALRAAHARWERSWTAYAGALVACEGDAACLRPLGGAFRRDHEALTEQLAAVSGGLEAGCAQLGPPAQHAAAALAFQMEAAREAGVAGDTATYSDHLRALRGLHDAAAESFVSRFVALCAPRAAA